MNGFNPMGNMNMSMPGQGGGFNPMANMSMGMPPMPRGGGGGSNDLMKMLMLMMLMSGGKGFNPYTKETAPTSIANAIGKLIKIFGIPGTPLGGMTGMFK